MEPLSPRTANPLDRPALSDRFRKWYYEQGNGLFLTWFAMDAYFLATQALHQERDRVPDEDVRKAFSQLQTQMKIDLAVYTIGEAGAQIGAAREQVTPASV